MMKALLALLVTVLYVPVPTYQGEALVPTKPVLLVIDTQNAFLPYMDEADVKPGLNWINHYIALFRVYDFPVIRIYHSDPSFGPEPGSDSFDFSKEIQIEEGDAKVIKNFPSGFKKTELDKILKEKGCNALFLCGLSATGCVLATYYGGLDLDYDVFMLKGGLISNDHALTQAVQEICRTIDYYTLKLLLRNLSGK